VVLRVIGAVAGEVLWKLAVRHVRGVDLHHVIGSVPVGVIPPGRGMIGKLGRLGMVPYCGWPAVLFFTSYWSGRTRSCSGSVR